MIVAITGGNGFIGRRLVARCLAAGHEVRLLTRKSVSLNPKGIRYFQGDLCRPDASLMRFVEGADCLFHCAGEVRDTSKMHAVHVEGTSNLLEAARGNVGHWVQLSSVGVYGQVRRGVVTESSRWNPSGTYEETKAASDRLLLEVSGTGHLSSTILRPSIVFGEEMPNHSLRQMAAMVRRGVFFYVGGKTASANYIYVENVVDALMACACNDAARNRVFNLSDYCTTEEFVTAMAAALSVKPPRVVLPEMPVRLLARCLGMVPRWPLTPARVDAMTVRSRYSIDHIRSALGYAHAVSMQEAIRRSVQVWFTR